MTRIKIGQIGIGHNHGAAKMAAVRKFPEQFDVIGYAEENEEWIKKRGELEAYRGLSRLSVDEIIVKCNKLLREYEGQTLELLKKNKTRLQKLSKYLVEQKTIVQPTLEMIDGLSE